MRIIPADAGAIAEGSAWSGDWPDLKPKDIVLRDRGAGHDLLVWESAVADQEAGDRLVVSLAKAEQLTLELTSPVNCACRISRLRRVSFRPSLRKARAQAAIR